MLYSSALALIWCDETSVAEDFTVVRSHAMSCAFSVSSLFFVRLSLPPARSEIDQEARPAVVQWQLLCGSPSATRACHAAARPSKLCRSGGHN